MKTNAIILFMLLFLSIYSCKKNKENTTDNTPAAVPLSFTSLKAARTGIKSGEETTVTAEATGTNLTYSWQASSGSIVGSGSQVSYGSICNSCIGDNTVSCTVSDGTTSETKSIIITIK